MGGDAIIADANGKYTGTYSSEEAYGTSANEIFELMEGSDEIIFDISGAKTIGDNTVILSKGEKLTVRLNGDDNTTYTETEKSGKDTIVNVFMNKSGFGKTKLGSITFQDPYGTNHPDGVIIRGGNGYMQTLDLFGKYIDKTKAKKGQTIKGSFYNETILGSKKADKIYTGAGDDRIDAYKGKDKIYINGGGRKEITFGLDKGNDTLKFTGDGKEAKTILNFLSPSYNGFRKIGKNLYIDNYSNDTHKRLTTQTISDYFDLNDGLSSSLEDYIYINEFDSEHEKLLSNRLDNAMIDVYGDKKRNVIGTNCIVEDMNLGDYLHGSKKADKIYTGTGYDIINAGKGNDKIYLNSTGDKEIIINNGDGNDTIYLNNFTKDVYLKINGADDIRKGYSADGKDLYLYRTFNSGKSIKTEKTTIKDFSTYWKYGENSGSLNLFINGQEYIPVNFRSEDKNLNVQMTRNYTIDSSVMQNKFFGTKKADNVTIQGTGTVKMILTGGGNDTITVKNSANTISGGQGNDTINVLTSGDIYINHTTGDGNDTITIGNPAPNNMSINLKLQGKQFNNYESYYSNYFIAMRQGFSIKGDDLVMQIPAGLNKFETITFKDYYKEGSLYNAEKININMTVNEHNYNPYYTGTLKKCLEKWSFWATGNYDAIAKRTVYDYVVDHKTSFYYDGKGKALMKASSMNDNYIANLNKKSNLIITDTEGDDTLYINAKQSDLSVFFNVDKYKRVDVRGDGVSDDLFIFNKSKLTAGNLKNAFTDKGSGYIRINHAFENSEAKWTESDGFIENIFIGKNISDLTAGSLPEWTTINGNEVAMSATISSITEKVTAWLSKHTKYNDAFDVLYSGNTKDINSLLKCYTSEKIRLNKNLI